ncbi:MAG: hypothetical protein RL608_1327, partial [Bacteroidota bacterium]
IKAVGLATPLGLAHGGLKGLEKKALEAFDRLHSKGVF